MENGGSKSSWFSLALYIAARVSRHKMSDALLLKCIEHNRKASVRNTERHQHRVELQNGSIS